MSAKTTLDTGKVARLKDQLETQTQVERIRANPRLLDTIEFYPPHDKRLETPEYKAAHRHLVVELDLPCLICGVRYSTLSDEKQNPYGAKALETHHHAVEWALANAIDVDKFNATILPHLKYRHPNNPAYQKDFTVKQVPRLGGPQRGQPLGAVRRAPPGEVPRDSRNHLPHLGAARLPHRRLPEVRAHLPRVHRRRPRREWKWRQWPQARPRQGRQETRGRHREVGLGLAHRNAPKRAFPAFASSCGGRKGLTASPIHVVGPPASSSRLTRHTTDTRGHFYG